MKLDDLLDIMPEVSTHFVEDLGKDVLYDAYVWDWDVKIVIPLPGKWVGAWQLHVLKREVDLRVYKVRPIEAICYALATYFSQPGEVRECLKQRFGQRLNEARTLAANFWQGMDSYA